MLTKKDWKIHNQVIKFWEKNNKEIVCYYDEYLNWRNTYIYFYLNKNEMPPGYINPDAKNVIAYQKDNVMLYKLNDKWYSEQEILRLIKLKVFI